MKALLALLFLTSCISIQVPAQSNSHFKKVVYIVFENEDYAPVLSQPDFARYSALGASFTQFLAEAHPSQGNYIAMIAGSTLGVLNDRNYDLDKPHLGDQLEARGMDWKNYVEGYPGNCFTGPTQGTFARKHAPFLSFITVTNNPDRCAKIVNASTNKQYLITKSKCTEYIQHF